MPQRALIPNWYPLATVIVAIVTRFVPHPWNLTPIGAMFLFWGFSASRPLALLLPLSAYALSDLALNGVVYHTSLTASALWVWLAFALVWAIGRILVPYRSFIAVYVAAVAASLVFFAVSNFGEWLVGSIYPHTPSGLAAAYVAAIPFLQGTLVGDFTYATVFFGVAATLASISLQRGRCVR